MYKILSIAMVLVFAMSIMAGCAKKTEPTTPDQAAVKETKPVEVVLWEQEEPNNDPIYDKVFEVFSKQNPNIKVTRVHYTTDDLRSQFQTTVLAGEGPDIVFGPDDNLGVFNAMQLLQPLDEIVDKSFLDTLDAKSVDGCRISGKLLGMPDRQGNNIMLVYNKDLIPTPPQTVDEMIEMAKKFTNEKDGKYGLVFQAYEPFFISWVANGLGGKVFDDKYQPTLNTPAFVEEYKFLYDLFNVHKVIPKDCNYDVANNLFKEGKAAMIINGPWSWGEYEKANIKIGLAQLPKLSNGQYGSAYTSTKAYMVSKNVTDPAKKEAVKKVLELFGSKDFQLEFAKASGWMPTNKEAMNDPVVADDPKFKDALEGMKVGTAMPIVPEMRAIWDALKLTVPDIMTGKIKPEEAAAKAQEEAVKGIANFNK
jgi:maltose-binding protein MalE